MLRRGGATAAATPTPGADGVPGSQAPAVGAVGASIGVAAAPFAIGGSATVTLVERAQAGDRAAFEVLMERHVDRAYRTARAILGNESDAHDATQDAFLDAWRQRRQLRDPTRFDAWLTRIVVNSCRETLRGRRRRAVREIAASDVLDPVEGLPASGPSADERAASIDVIERAFDRLSADDRAVLVLHHLESQSLAEIADTLEASVGAVKSRLHAARRSLERALEAEYR
jgi:RNA polymerase sigma-70 factor, ECF subfamily